MNGFVDYLRFVMGWWSASGRPNIGPGRIEFTIPACRLEFALLDDRLEFTLPKTADEFGMEKP